MRRHLRLLAALLALLSGALVDAQAATPTETPATATATPTPPAPVVKSEHFLLRRPIAVADGMTHWADRTYPYGSTQWGARSVHLGLEFVNPRHTPVLAAAAGEVVYAGSDSETLLGPRLDYYGLVVVLAHDLLSLDGRQVFTLYAHLERIDVEAGQAIEAGEALGTVGSSGVALGAHLHFETRFGEPYDYRGTRNPALWLENYPGRGMIAGLISDAAGQPIPEKRLVARSETRQREVYSYGGEPVNSDPVWGENFTVSDLPAGDYELIVLKRNGAIAYRQPVTVEADKITFVAVAVDE